MYLNIDNNYNVHGCQQTSYKYLKKTKSSANTSLLYVAHIYLEDDLKPRGKFSSIDCCRFICTALYHFANT